MRWPVIVLAVGLSSGLVRPSFLHAQESPQNIIAAHIRAQGYACDNPLSATRDAKLSKRDNSVWVLQCSNAIYRVSLIPDMAAKVERLPGRGNESRVRAF